MRLELPNDSFLFSVWSVVLCFCSMGVLLSLGPQVQAAVTSTGNVSPTPPVGGGAVSGPFVIGNDGVGTVQVAGGTGITNSNAAIVGDQAEGIGVVTLSGLGSNWELTSSTGDLTVGDAGVGSITISDSAKLGVTDDSFLGSQSGGMGKVTVTGLGSVWDNNDDITVGESGLGIVEVLAAGQIISNALTLASNSSGAGRATVSGELSRWQVSGSINIGSNGIGRLDIEAGGRVVNTTTAMVGNAAGSVGVIEITDVGSLWDIGNSMTVGNMGDGTVRVLASGRVVSDQTVTLASAASSHGEILIDGAGSRWSVAGALNSGAGDALVTISAGGVLATSAASTITASGRVALEGGRWESAVAQSATALTVSGLLEGSGTLDVSGVTLNQSGSRRGRLHTGLGNHLLLTGALTNSGFVDLDGGELEVVGATTNNFEITAGPDSTLHFGSTGLDNKAGAQLAITGGTVDVFGLVDNNSNAEIAVVGGATGIFHDEVTNDGMLFVSPGSEIIMLEDLQLSPSTTLSVGLTAVEDAADPTEGFGQAVTSGEALLAGTLNVSLATGFVPGLGDSFQIISAAEGINGTFAHENLPTLAGGLVWQSVYGEHSLLLTVVSNGLTADFDGDGDVDGNDLNVWQGAFGAGNGADADGDGDSDGVDFLAWQRQLGSGSPITAANSSVPEPATLLLLCMVASFEFSSRRNLHPRWH